MPRKKKPLLPERKETLIESDLASIGPVEDFEFEGKSYQRVKISIGYIMKSDKHYILDLEHDAKKITLEVIKKFSLEPYFKLGESS